MTKLCPRGKAAAKENLRYTLRPTQMHMLVKFVLVKLKIPLV